MQKFISKLLKEMREYDQHQRKSIIKKYGQSMRESINKYPFYELKGACLQRFKIVKCLVRYNLLKTGNDYHYAATILIQSQRKKDHFLALWLISKAEELKNKKGIILFKDKYYTTRGWNRKQIEQEYKKWLKSHK